MKKIKVAEASNSQLDWLVAKCEGPDVFCFAHPGAFPRFLPTTDWSQMGPIIDREFISLTGWRSSKRDVRVAHLDTESASTQGMGPTALIAAARCYVVSKLGDIVEVLEELE